MTMPAEFIETSTAMRIKIAASVVALLGVLESAKRWLMPALIDRTKALPPCEQYELLVGSIKVLFFSVPVVLSIVMGTFAIRLLKHQQFPLPGAWVWRRTKVSRGRAVRIRAYLILASCLALYGFVAWGSSTFAKAAAAASCDRPKAAESIPVH